MDPDFPPVRSSLDGRKASHHHHPQGKPSTIIHCYCGLPATAKVVQRDGPNFGRFYLTCGQDRPGVRKRRARVVAEKKSPAEQQLTKDALGEPSTQLTIVNTYAKRIISVQQPSTLTATRRASEEASPKQSSPQWRKCDFFQWDKDVSRGADAMGYNTRYSVLAWQHFVAEQDCTLYQNEIGPSQIRQGAVGNCWFLSALAVVAEKPYFNILPHNSLNDMGCYQINQCLDGKWTPTLIDSNLPVVVDNIDENQKTSSRRRTPMSHPSVRGGVLFDFRGEEGGLHRKTSRTSNLVAYPAFCAAPNLQLWPALIEKAYAKAHGCYVLEPSLQYCCIPFSCLGARDSNRKFPF